MENIKEIDSWMEHIWLDLIPREYDRSRILEESNLHSTVYFHLRKYGENSGNKNLFIYSEMPFSTTKSGKGNKNPRVDIAIIFLDEKKGVPKDLLAVIEIKHYDKHYNSIGVSKDMDHLMTLRKGIYYPYTESPKKLKAKRAYFLYLVDEGDVDSTLKQKLELLRKDRYLKVFLGFGKKGEFIIQT